MADDDDYEDDDNDYEYEDEEEDNNLGDDAALTEVCLEQQCL